MILSELSPTHVLGSGHVLGHHFDQHDAAPIDLSADRVNEVSGRGKNISIKNIMDEELRQQLTPPSQPSASKKDLIEE